MNTLARFAVSAVTLLVASPLACSSSSSTTSTNAPPASGPTFYRDVEPITQTKCAGCHYDGGIGSIALDASNAVSFASLIAQKTTSREMPPWPPGPLSPPLHGARALTQEQVALLAQWASNGAPLGDVADHKDRSPDITFDPGRVPDARAMMGGANVYVAPSDGNSDEVRCFVIDLPAGTPNAWVTAINWIPGQPNAIHHIGGLTVDPKSAAIARSFYGVDGRAGYECAGGFGAGVIGTAGFSASGAGKDTGTMMPSGTGIFVPAGSSVVLSVHYIVSNVVGVDSSGVELWFAPAGATALRPMVQYTFNAPSELPCPTGVTSDPNDSCSRAWGVAHVKNEATTKVQASADFMLKKCGTDLASYYAKLAFSPPDPSHFVIPTHCEDAMPYDGIIQVVHAHMHTRGANARIEAQNDDGTWRVLLDIPEYKWTWEGAYALEHGIALKAKTKLRLSCTFDNGTANQWSATTHQPFHGTSPSGPLEAPHYVVAGPERGDDMCTAFLTIERPPYKGASYVDACHETQAAYDDLCADGQVTFVGAPCSDKLEQAAVELVQAPPNAFINAVCGPKGPSATVGATCDLAASCAIACAATVTKWAGVSPTCVAACKANVNAYGKGVGQPSNAASPHGGFQLDRLVACAAPACASSASWQDFLGCMEIACTDETKWCYPKG